MVGEHAGARVGHWTADVVRFGKFALESLFCGVDEAHEGRTRKWVSAARKASATRRAQHSDAINSRSTSCISPPAELPPRVFSLPLSSGLGTFLNLNPFISLKKAPMSRLPCAPPMELMRLL